MTRLPDRRRFLSISASALACSALGAGAAPMVARWRGTALGAGCSLALVGLDERAAAPVFREVRAELDRLEDIFSLYRPGSEISRLNRARRLDAPAPDLLEVLGTCGHLNAVTDGAFDPTVQPLFAAFGRAAAEDRIPADAEIAGARALVGWDGVAFDSRSVRLARAGAALTLNGIAQGHVTDRIAALLRRRGLRDVLVDMGEVAALGTAGDGAPWRVGVAAPDGTLVRRLRLSDRALATSAPMGTVLDAAGRLGHIFDPATGGQATEASVVSVSAPRAVIADGLSTALCIVPKARQAGMVRKVPGARLEWSA